MGFRLVPASSQYLQTTVECPVNTAAGQQWSAAVAFWSEDLSANQAIFSFGINAGSNRIVMFSEGAAADGINFNIIDGASGATVSTTNTIQANAWNLGVLVENGASDHRIFLNNGGRFTSTQTHATTAADRLLIGARINAGTRGAFYAGRVGFLCVWKNGIVLDDTEVALLYAGVPPWGLRGLDAIAALYLLDSGGGIQENLLEPGRYGMSQVAAPTPWAADPWSSSWPPLERQAKVGVSSAVSANLTGVSATGAVGNFAATASGTRALTGVSATGAVGSITVNAGGNVSAALTGVSATGAVGTLASPSSASPVLSGVSATGAVGSFTTTAGSLALTDQISGKIFQRVAGGTTKAVSFAGTYTGQVPASVEVKVVNASGGATVVDWTALSGASIAGGNWSGALTVPQGGFYHFFARSKDASGNIIHTTAESSNSWGVGAVIALIGQSNSDKMFSVSASPPTADSLTRKFSGASGTISSNSGNGAIRLANLLRSAIGVPIMLGYYGVGSTALLQAADGGAGYWLDTSNGSVYDIFADGLTAYGGDCEAIIWYQGESECSATEYQANFPADYKAGLTTLYNRILALTGRSATNLPFFLTLLGRRTNVGASNPEDYMAMYTAMREWVSGTTGAFIGGNAVDLPLSDGVHLTSGSYERIARRYAQSILKQLGLVTFSGKGPEIAQARLVAQGSAIIDVTINHEGGSALRDTAGGSTGSGLTDFEVLVNGSAATISTKAFVQPNKVRLTLSAAPAIGDTVALRHLYGQAPDITSITYDNTTPQGDTIGLPVPQTLSPSFAVGIGGMRSRSPFMAGVGRLMSR